MIEEIGESIKENLKDKMISPFYGTFIVSWCLWNWEVLYVTLFVDGTDLIKIQNITKIQYLQDYFHMTHWWGGLMLAPFISAGIMMFVISRFISPIFYKESVRLDMQNKKERLTQEKKMVTQNEEILIQNKEILAQKKEMLIQEKEFEEEKKKLFEAMESKQTKLLEQQKQTIEQQKEVEKLKMELAQKEKEREEDDNFNNKWTKEYIAFKKSNYGKYFKDLSDIIYKYGGEANNYGDNGGGMIDTEALAYFDASRLINISSADIISLTKKGLFFMKKYLEEKLKK